MITKELLEEWVSALRSGKYEQGFGRLRTINDKFCCLGVFCDIAKEDINGSWLNSAGYCFIGEEDSYAYTAFLPKELPLDDQLTLQEMNDKEYSFEEIADYIEENILSEYE